MCEKQNVMPNVECAAQHANQHQKEKQVREEEHDVGTLMLYVMNLVLDDKERKKNAQKRVFIVEDLG
jgi:hypothetical protein